MSLVIISCVVVFLLTLVVGYRVGAGIGIGVTTYYGLTIGYGLFTSLLLSVLGVVLLVFLVVAPLVVYMWLEDVSS